MEAAGPRSTHGVTQLQGATPSPQNTIPNCYFLSLLKSSKGKSTCQFLVWEWHFDHTEIRMKTWTELFRRAISLSVWMIGKTHACRNRVSLPHFPRILVIRTDTLLDKHWEAVLWWRLGFPPTALCWTARCHVLQSSSTFCSPAWHQTFLIQALLHLSHILLRFFSHFHPLEPLPSIKGANVFWEWVERGRFRAVDFHISRKMATLKPLHHEQLAGAAGSHPEACPSEALQSQVMFPSSEEAASAWRKPGSLDHTWLDQLWFFLINVSLLSLLKSSQCRWYDTLHTKQISRPSPWWKFANHTGEEHAGPENRACFELGGDQINSRRRNRSSLVNVPDTEAAPAWLTFLGTCSLRTFLNCLTLLPWREGGGVLKTSKKWWCFMVPVLNYINDERLFCFV